MLQSEPRRCHTASSNWLRIMRNQVNVWGALERQPFYVALVDGIATFLGADARSALELPFSLNSAGELRTLAQDAGLKNIRIRFEHRTTRYPTAAALVTGFMGATPVTAQFLALSDDRRQAFVTHVVERIASYVDDAGLAVPQENHFLTASKSGLTRSALSDRSVHCRTSAVIKCPQTQQKDVGGSFAHQSQARTPLALSCVLGHIRLCTSTFPSGTRSGSSVRY